MRKLILAALLALSACGEHYAQTTSGADYLARYDAAVAASPAASASVASASARSDTRPDTDALVRRAAAVEPVLTFPARFGLARIANGRLTAIPAEEAELWTALAQKYAALGAFVPISPLIAETTAATLDSDRPSRHWGDTGETVRVIRLGAARQHVDAVLVYEIGAQARRGLTPFALMDLTILGGAFLPTRTIEARGVASALLMDVRNGYPYGTASAEADLSSLSATFGKGRRTEELREEVALTVAGNLVPEVDAMLGELTSQMLAKARPAG